MSSDIVPYEPGGPKAIHRVQAARRRARDESHKARIAAVDPCPSLSTRIMERVAESLAAQQRPREKEPALTALLDAIEAHVQQSQALLRQRLDELFRW